MKGVKSSNSTELLFTSRIDPPRNIEIVSVERYTGTVRWKAPIAIDDIEKYIIILALNNTDETVLNLTISSSLASYDFTELQQGTSYKLYMSSLGRHQDSLPKLVRFHTRIYNFRRPESCIHVSFKNI